MALSDAHAAVLLRNNFNKSIASSCYWHFPACKSPSDFIGRTEFKCTRDSPLPVAENGNAIITLQSYDPAHLYFYGTDLISNKSFTLGHGVKVTVRAKMNTTTPGIVGGIFLYTARPGHTKVRDEIDFELLTDRPDEVHTNVYKRGGPANGDPQFVSYASGSITGYHRYEIEWLPNRVSWFVDGHLVRTEKKYVPRGPMNFHLNLWAPSLKWALASSPKLRPVSSTGSNKVFSMSIASVDVESITVGSGASEAKLSIKHGALKQG